MSEVIYLSDVRLSFPNLAEPQVRDNPDGTKKISYNAELIMPKEHPGLAQFFQLYASLMQKAFAEHANTVMQMIQNDRKLRCFGAGEEKINQRTFKPYDGYAGMYFLTVGNKNRPQVIQADGRPVNSDDTMAYQMVARKMYGGCRVNAAVRPWVQSNKHGKGIRCDLIAIQFLRDDTPFGESAPDVTGMFGATAQAAPAPAFMQPAAAAPAMPAPPFGMPTMPWQQ